MAAVATAAIVPFAMGPAGAVSFSNRAPINIPLPPLGQLYTPAEPYPSNISVSGFTGTVTDVNVTLCGLNATFPSDVNVMLVAPNGANAMIMSDVGGNGGVEGDPNPEQHDIAVSDLNLTLDDAAANPLPADSQLTSGTWRPVDDDTGELPLNENPDEDQFPFPAVPTNGSNVALSTFNGVAADGTWKLYVFDDYPAQPADGEFVLPHFSCGWSIDITTSGGGPTTTLGGSTTTVAPTTTTTAPPSEPVPPVADFDGDGDTDVSVFRPASGYWFVSGGSTTSFGTTGDIPVPGDYDGDGDTDVAVYRPSSGYWFVQGGGITKFGTSGDIPVPGDYDGDGDTDMAVFRPSTGYWFVNGGPIVSFGHYRRHPGARRLRRRRRHRLRRVPAVERHLVRAEAGDGAVRHLGRHPGAGRLRRRRRRRTSPCSGPSTGTWFVRQAEHRPGLGDVRRHPGAG